MSGKSNCSETPTIPATFGWFNDNVEVVAGENGEFHCTIKTILLTYKTHLNKKDYINWFCQQKGNGDLEFIRLAHETGMNNPVCPYEHTHVLARKVKGKTFNIHNKNKFNVDSCGVNIHPNIRKVIGEQHYQNTRKYLAKEDPENMDLLVPEKHFTVVWKETFLKLGKEGLYATAKSFAETNAMKSFINDLNLKPATDIADRETLEELRPRGWQLEAVKICLDNKKGWRRTIYWFVSNLGERGKSSFISWTDYVMPEKVHSFSSCGGQYHLASLMKDLIEGKKWKGDTIIFDFPRKYLGKDDIYEGLEALLNKKITSVKFTGSNVDFKSLKVIVFANFMPDMSAMSPDRFKIFRIEDTGNPASCHLLTQPSGMTKPSSAKEDDGEDEDADVSQVGERKLLENAVEDLMNKYYESTECDKKG